MPRTATAAEYVDSALCTGCHSEIAKTYRLTGMGRSLFRPRKGTAVEDFSGNNRVRHRLSNRDYTMEERDGNFYVRRSQTGFGDKEANVLERRIDYVIGSGNHARSYLHRTPEGRLVEMPVTWYSAKGGYWAMSPGFDRAGQSDLQRTILNDCLFCHNGYPTAAENAKEAGEAKFGELPEGIDCQRCHGPGSAHIKAAADAAAEEAIRDSIVNPAKLSRDRQLEVCMQCHLETTSAPLPHMIRRVERAPFSFRPGEPLGDYALFFDHTPGAGFDDKFEIAHAAYRLRKSACFSASEMTCTTCHNPHDAPRAERAAAHYSATCVNCHQAAHPEQGATFADCTGCHMPKRRTQDAVHVVMTDHHIQRRKPSGDLLAPLRESSHPYRGEVMPYYPPQLPRNAETELYLALAQVQQDSNSEAGIGRLERAIASAKPTQPDFYFELGRALGRRGDSAGAVRWHQEALKRNPLFRPAAVDLVGLYLATGQPSRAVELLEGIVPKLPPDSTLLTNLANAHLQQGGIGRARSLLDQALELDPDLPEARNLLGMVYAHGQNRPAAEESFRHALRVNPDMEAAHVNLANLLASGRNFAEAAYHFEQALTINPRNSRTHHQYALVFLVLGNRAKAATELRETLRLDPGNQEARRDLQELLAAH